MTHEKFDTTSERTVGDAERVTGEALRATWMECERQLYPIAMNDAPSYQRIVIAVRALADDLQSVASIEQLVEQWPNANERLDVVMAARGLSAAIVPRKQVSGAAFAIREREIQENHARQARKDEITCAREKGDEWVVIDESGNLDTGLNNPYRGVDMHLSTGLAVMTHVQASPTDGMPAYVVAVIKLDPSNGELLDAEPGIEDWKEHAQQADLEGHQAVLKQRISDLDTAAQ